MSLYITELIPNSRLRSVLAEGASSDRTLRLVDDTGETLIQSPLADTGAVEDMTWGFDGLFAEIKRAPAHTVIDRCLEGGWSVCGMALLLEERIVGVRPCSGRL